MFGAQFGLGALVGLLGPSLLHLAAQLDVTVNVLAWIFALRALGAGIGAVGAVGGTVAIWGETTVQISVITWGAFLCIGVSALNAVIPICTELSTLLGEYCSVSLYHLSATFQRSGGNKKPTLMSYVSLRSHVRARFIRRGARQPLCHRALCRWDPEQARKDSRSAPLVYGKSLMGPYCLELRRDGLSGFVRFFPR